MSISFLQLDRDKVTGTTLTQKQSRKLIRERGASKLRPLTLSLLKYLATNCYWLDKKSNTMQPRDFKVAKATIALNMGINGRCSEKTAAEHIKIAESEGLITEHKSFDGTASYYSLHLEPMLASPMVRDVNKERKKARRAVQATAQELRRMMQIEAEVLEQEAKEEAEAVRTNAAWHAEQEGRPRRPYRPLKPIWRYQCNAAS
jgi:hypothetical protein